MKISPSLFLISLLVLTACDGNEVRESLGLNRTAPDEFVVYSRPPLSVPPEFELKPPRPGEENLGASSTEAQARELLLGTKKQPASLDEVAETPDVDTAVTPVLTSDAPSGAQSSFLSKAGVDAANPDIREKLAKDVVEAPKKAKKAESLYESIVGAETAEPVVDAQKEAERLRSNRDEGKPVTDGDTPTEKTKPKSVIDRIW